MLPELRKPAVNARKVRDNCMRRYSGGEVPTVGRKGEGFLSLHKRSLE